MIEHLLEKRFERLEKEIERTKKALMRAGDSVLIRNFFFSC
ncbi:MAG: hypothetical protein RMH75_07160 [Archaeoglobaceae archaeon]|nr:hypothetical protein [Archaeoglobaceae archaeon]